ncbi:MAG: metal ABC transporter substrate-binding protein [Spirochaetes bacterium]|nr:metal ABC transporter substrate-binding protein [Spirochaetota bacterium]
MKTKLIITALVMALGLSACGSDKKADSSIVIGVAPGPYGDLAKIAIKPYLEKKGYSVELKEFSDWVQPNIALGNKSIDTNVFQHKVYLDKFAADKGLSLTHSITIPTASLGLYSKKYKSVSEIPNGASVTIPTDASNLARSLKFLQTIGLIKIKASVDLTKASEKDISENPKKLKFTPVEAAQLPRTLDGVDLSVISGNYAIAAGIYPTAIVREILEEKYINGFAFRTEDVDKQFVKDIREAVGSKEFQEIVDDPKNGFSDFQKPEWLKGKAK